jgi:hypothetical protein
VVRYDAAGNLLWARQFGSAADDFATGVSADGSGVYVAGWTTGALPGQASAGGTDAFVAKFRTASDAPPAIGPVIIRSSGPRGAVTTASVLTARAIGYDPDGEAVSYAYQWYRNGVAVSGATAATLDLARPGFGDCGDTITVRIIPSDASAGGAAAFASVRVVNSPPAQAALNHLATAYGHALAGFVSADSAHRSLGTADALLTFVNASYALKYASLALAWAGYAADVDPAAWGRAAAYARLACQYCLSVYRASASHSAFFAYVHGCSGWRCAKAAVSNP